MKNLPFLLTMMLAPVLAFSKPATRTIQVHYFEQAPFAYTEGGKMAGIEVEILNAFAEWSKKQKNTDIKYEYVVHPHFDEFYTSIKSGNTLSLGIGTVTINDERKKDVQFSAPYLKNISLLISDGRVPTLDKLENCSVNFKNMKGLTIKGSTHAEYMEKLKQAYLPGMTIEYVDQPAEIPVKIASDSKLFGYVDIITFWAFVKKSDHFIKIHRVANRDHEDMGIVFPKNSEIIGDFNEFFESGFGFTATKQYRNILEKYLAHEVLSTVEIN